jgi:c-di-GMP-binding flagellar brake protein YcgR
MVMGFPGIRLYPLQSVQYFKEDDPVAATIFLVGIGVFAVLVVLINVVRKRAGGPIAGGAKGKSAAVTPRRFSIFTLNRLASSYGLNRDQAKVLEYVFRINEVADPARVLSNPTLLDKHFKHAYKRIERGAETEEEAQQKLAFLFSVRNTIESSQNSSEGIKSTSQVAENMAAVIAIGRDSHPVRVISGKGDTVLVECPRNPLGTPLRLTRGTKVTLSFFTKSNKGYAFDSRVLGMTDTREGPALQLAHSDRPKPLTQRRFRRKQAVINCTFSFVKVEEVGRKKERKMIVDKNRFKGAISDISIGGCAIKTAAAVSAGSRLKIEFAYSGDRPAAALGQVLRTNRSGTVGTIIHVKFIKVPRRTMNSINAMVFNYDED